LGLALLLFEGGEHLIDDAGVDGLSIEGEVTAAGGAGELTQDIFVQRGADWGAVVVANPVAAFIGVGIRDEAAGFGADADGEDDDVFLGGLAGPLGEFGVGIATVAEDDEAVVAGGAFVKGLDGEADGAADLAAAPGTEKVSTDWMASATAAWSVVRGACR
jgi:hypothetical protein